MEGIFSFLWEHPSLTAILIFVILFIYNAWRTGRRNVDQAKDNIYGSASGWAGRKIERDWKNNRADVVVYLAEIVLIIFLIYRFLKWIHWI